MKHLYFIRHGESEMNRKNQWAGSSDTPLTDKGHDQAKQAGREASKQGLSFDIIVSSPLERAHHTAKHIASATDYPHENIELNPIVVERSYGELEGVSGISAVAAKHWLDESAIDVKEGVEPLEQMQKRANDALEYLKSLDHDTVLVVSHGSFGRALYRAVKDLPITKRDIRYNNAELVKFI